MITNSAKYGARAGLFLLMAALALGIPARGHADPIHDFGDADANFFPVLLAQDGARHVVTPGVFLGVGVDAETNAYASLLANGDDTGAPGDDEDGIAFSGLLVPGRVARVLVSASTNGYLQGWVDFVQAGWTFASAFAISNVALTAGTQVVEFLVPESAPAGTVAARFRFSTQPDLAITGEAPDGEVEDYLVEIVKADFGDAPEVLPGGEYATTLANNGPYHVVNGVLYLGAGVDLEADGQPSTNADGDDTDTAGDDEDGVYWRTPLVPGRDATVDVVASDAGIVNGWIDFGRDDAWNINDDNILDGAAVAAGTNTFVFPVPGTATLGATYARIRLSSAGGLDTTGPAADGEVEDARVVIEAFDFGDAYGAGDFPTLREQDGARHSIQAGVYLGEAVDAEDDAQISVGAAGDDTTGIDDEDGINILDSLEADASVAMHVVASTNGYLQGWIDFDRDGFWGAGEERLFTDAPVVAGTNALWIAVPSTAELGATYGRFRFSTQAGVGVSGPALDGEVEDFELQLVQREYDYGDATAASAYPTLHVDGGARHRLGGTLRLGAAVDADTDGQPDGQALGDDLDGDGDDEDGIAFAMAWVAGADAELRVEASGAGYLQGWVDFNDNGDWADDAREQVISNRVVVAGTNTITLHVPGDLTAAVLVTRFRLSTQLDLGMDGTAPDGEVEDYHVALAQADFGDAPEPPLGGGYRTTLANTGAYHVIDGLLYLGEQIDADADGQASAAADGDDSDTILNDEDGILWNPDLIAGGDAEFDVVASTDGLFSAWVDFDADGQWTDSRDEVVSDLAVLAGTNHVVFTVPIDAQQGASYARFRLSRQAGLPPDGPAPDGEVEDGLVVITRFDFGDAFGFGGYPTLLSQNGARHAYVPGVRLGLGLDDEGNAQAGAAGTGDDINGIDDEDGVSIAGVLPRGGAVAVSVVASTNGYLQGWVDFARKDYWVDDPDRVFSDQPLAAGTNVLLLAIPSNAVAGNTYARFRFGTQPGVAVSGPATDGEVEDYLVQIASESFDYGDAPSGFAYPTVLGDFGARHQLAPGVFLGEAVDADGDGQPSSGATGDDLDGDGDDEDGVAWLNPLRPGGLGVVRVSVSAVGVLQGWIDMARDGNWSASEERIFSDQALVAGAHVLSFLVPTNAVPGATFARFRFATVAGLGVGGDAADGEVEDYAVQIFGGVGPTPLVEPCAIWLQRPNRDYGIDVQSWNLPSLGPTNSRVVRVADDWPGDGRRVTGCRWWGSYINWNGNPLAPPASSRPTSFRVTLYADGVSTNDLITPEPGIELASAMVGLLGFGNTNAALGQATELLFATNSLAFVSPVAFDYEYEYRAFFTNAWPVLAGRRYWLGVEAVNATSPNYRWGWCVAWPREAQGRRAMLYKSMVPGWSGMNYPPNVYPWTTATNHPDFGQPVEMAFALFSDDCPRRAHQWPQAADALIPATEAAWLRLGDAPGATGVRADQVVADGRRCAHVVWQGAYARWMETQWGSWTNAVAAPTGNGRPLGFLLTLRAGGGAGCAPGGVLTNLFVTMASCGERYETAWPQPWLGAGRYMHAYRYEVDLLDPAVLGEAWSMAAGTTNWFSVQALFPAAFTPGLGTHLGWGWRTVSNIVGCASVASANSGSTWFTAFRTNGPAGQLGNPFDLAFDFLTDAPGLSPLYEQPEIISLAVPTNAPLRVAAVGDLGSGVQVLQASTNLRLSLWSDIETNILPRAWPYTNQWIDARPAGTNVFLRVQQR